MRYELTFKSNVTGATFTISGTNDTPVHDYMIINPTEGEQIKFEMPIGTTIMVVDNKENILIKALTK